MVTLSALWLPVILSAIVVFIASSVIHMALPWHNKDFRRFPAEDDALDSLRKLGLEPGDYAAPMAENMAAMNSDEYKAKVAKGPQVMLTVLSPNNSMGLNLAKWFVYLIVVGVFAAYVAGAALGSGADYMQVFRLTSTVAFLGYALAIWQSWIWYSRGLGYTVRTTIDGLVYALLTGGIFGWLWPAAA
jgi:hypothetical protein